MAPSPTIRRLLKETAELSSPSSNPNAAFFAAPVSDANLHEWHFTLLGPPSPSPYAGGIFHGRITLPTTYPLKPPNFRFLTPSGRFEVNREICLSISGFHEETWMPAWGVRTALTALRSFMAEPGTSGQIGGLEASQEVRMRLAKESRTWKCDACKRSNETIMREWWGICREAGLNVEEEGLTLEALPDGMKVEARDPNVNKQKPADSDKSASSSAATNSNTQLSPSTQQEPLPTITPPSPKPRPEPLINTDHHTHKRSGSSTSSLAPPSEIPIITTPTAEATQASAEAILTNSELASTRTSSTDDRRITNMHSSPRAAAAASATINASNNRLTGTIQSAMVGSTSAAAAAAAQPLQRIGQRERDRSREQQTITIDRAIAGVFLALCFMVLKRIFYPAGFFGSVGRSAAGHDDFYLQRE
ncbi:hypothetical protein B0A52_05431 [Exophiala mesophila]|uniref:UBC core domain-containing protein n=1 Tax=Exophiala mesophila TaxID=212818 RepID=A0A438N5E4_EXOME|nr:hypothetical protein B0A52_05431 [Exophiala mesophila]